MKKLQTLGMSAVVATAAFSLFTLTANAQQPPAAAPAAPAAVPVKPAAPVAPPVAAKAPAPAAAPAAAAAPAKSAAPKVASVCKGLDEAGCKAKASECTYVVPTAANATTGKVPSAYCRKTAGVAVKKPVAAAPVAVKPVATAPAAAAPKPAAPPAAAAAKQ